VRLTQGPCRACGAPMWWVKTEAGNNMPLDLEPDHEHGNVVLHASDNRALVLASSKETTSGTSTRTRAARTRR
jgi:hypothetical protein